MRVEGNIDFENELKWGTTRTKSLERSFKQAQAIVTVCSKENLFGNRTHNDCDSCPLFAECTDFWSDFVSETMVTWLKVKFYRDTIAMKLRYLWVEKHKLFALGK